MAKKGSPKFVSRKSHMDYKMHVGMLMLLLHVAVVALLAYRASLEPTVADDSTKEHQALKGLAYTAVIANGLALLFAVGGYYYMKDRLGSAFMTGLLHLTYIVGFFATLLVLSEDIASLIVDKTSTPYYYSLTAFSLIIVTMSLGVGAMRYYY